MKREIKFASKFYEISALTDSLGQVDRRRLAGPNWLGDLGCAMT